MPRPAHEASGQQRPFGALAGPRCCDVTKPPELLDRAMLPSRWRYLAMKAFEATKISLAKLAKLAALRRENNYDPRDKLRSAGDWIISPRLWTSLDCSPVAAVNGGPHRRQLGHLRLAKSESAGQGVRVLAGLRVIPEPIRDEARAWKKHGVVPIILNDPPARQIVEIASIDPRRVRWVPNPIRSPGDLERDRHLRPAAVDPVRGRTTPRGKAMTTKKPSIAQGFWGAGGGT